MDDTTSLEIDVSSELNVAKCRTLHLKLGGEFYETTYAEIDMGGLSTRLKMDICVS